MLHVAGVEFGTIGRKWLFWQELEQVAAEGRGVRIGGGVAWAAGRIALSTGSDGT